MVPRSVPGAPLAILALVASAGSPLGAGFPIAPVITIPDAGPGTPLEVSFLLEHQTSANGWILVVCHDPLGLELESVGLGSVGSTVNGGNPPDFFELNLHSNAWSMGVVVSLTGQFVLPAGTDLEIGEAVYSGLADGAWPVCTCDLTGQIPSTTVIVYSGASIAPPPACGTVTVDTSLNEFRRGDANLDGAIDVADPVFILGYLFVSGPAPACREAADVDSDDAETIGDAIYLLGHLFDEGPPPAAPYPECAGVVGADCAVPGCP